MDTDDDSVYGSSIPRTTPSQHTTSPSPSPTPPLTNLPSSSHRPPLHPTHSKFKKQTTQQQAFETEGEPSEILSTSTRKGRKLTSPVWDHFERIDVNGEKKAKCLHCDKLMSAKGSNGTSHLRDHMVKRCIRKHQKVDIRQMFLSVSKRADGTTSVENTNFSQEISRKELANMVIVHEYPLAMVDHIGFRRFVNSLNPSFKIISRNTLRIAKDILAVPASTVASESAFSMGGRVVSPHRSRLASSTVEALMCMQNWILGDYSGASIDNSEACATILEDRDTVDVETNVGTNFGGEVVDLDSMLLSSCCCCCAAAMVLSCCYRYGAAMLLLCCCQSAMLLP
ncbi:hypothetical protein BVRB_1g022080 [Beta vulgaris subsp. vulgaris]|nr:hypothetical protein BVRB_1g022080 [Beta vulgaris subsp. vulgaris]